MKHFLKFGTKKARCPVILLGPRASWASLFARMDAMAAMRTISPEDARLLQVAETPQQAVQLIQAGHQGPIMSLLRALKSQPPAPPIENPAEVDRLYSSWRVRLVSTLMTGYAVFYFVRKNFSMANNAFSRVGFTNTEVGLILSVSIPLSMRSGNFSAACLQTLQTRAI